MKDYVLKAKMLNKELRSLLGNTTDQALQPPTEDRFDYFVTDIELSKKTKKLFYDGHHARAVEEAFKYLDNIVQKLSKLKSQTGSSLMKTVFSANNPKIMLNSGISRSEKDEQLGYMEIYSGVMIGIRNPRAHDSDWEDSEERAIQLLSLANHLIIKVKQVAIGDDS